LRAYGRRAFSGWIGTWPRENLFGEIEGRKGV
jgi:hypothetical protein